MLAPPPEFLGPDAANLLQSKVLETAASMGDDGSLDDAGEASDEGMSDDDLISALVELEEDAVFFGNDDAQERAKLMEYYLGEPFGNEEEGRSQVISTDVLDGVEGMLPLVLRPFVSSDDVVAFGAQSPVLPPQD